MDGHSTDMEISERIVAAVAHSLEQERSNATKNNLIMQRHVAPSQVQVAPAPDTEFSEIDGEEYEREEEHPIPIEPFDSSLGAEADDERPITSPPDATEEETVEAPPVEIETDEEDLILIQEETPVIVVPDSPAQSITDDDEVELVNVVYPPLPFHPTKRRCYARPSTSRDSEVLPVGAAVSEALNDLFKSHFGDDLNEEQHETSLYPAKHAEIACQTEPGIVYFDAESQTDAVEEGLGLGRKRTYEDQEDDGLSCPICYEAWDRSGDHRLVALNCGHLFGESCVKKWLMTLQTKDRCCPTCKTRCQVQHIRPIFARKVCYTDSFAVNRLQNQIYLLTQRNFTLEKQLERERELQRIKVELLAPPAHQPLSIATFNEMNPFLN